MLSAFVCAVFQPLSAQNLFQRLDSVLSAKQRKVNFDTAYIMRPYAKWTLSARMNLSGTAIESEGIDRTGSSMEGQHFHTRMVANSKATFSVGVSYYGLTISAGLNPAKMLGKYHDYELNFNLYRHNFGFDIVFQDAKNFTGWHEEEGMERMELADGMLKVQTLNINAYYAFNSRRFSYPAAFSQSYVQRRSAGSFLLAASGMGQRAIFDWNQVLRLNMVNIGLGAGYGYNYVPGRGWLLHISALPTFIAYNNTSMTIDDNRTPLNYHFPEFIITTRGAVVRQWNKMFLGLSLLYNYTSIGDKSDINVSNSKWHVRTMFGVRL